MAQNLSKIDNRPLSDDQELEGAEIDAKNVLLT